MLQKVKQVNQLFKSMDNSLMRFRKFNGIGCPAGCISCCLKPDLEANVLEFLPLAWHLVTTNQHDEVLEKIESGQSVCVGLNTVRSDSSNPGCRFYDHRGAICRLFGSATVKNRKTKKLELYACQILKENYSESWSEMQHKINLYPDSPKVVDYYVQLSAIDERLANDYNPINQSIYKAIMKVALDYSHRPKPNTPIGKAG